MSSRVRIALNVSGPLCALVFALACSADREANDGYRACENDDGCGTGETCYRGYCLSDGSNKPNDNAGKPDSGAPDSTTPDEDSGADEDGGASAPEPCSGMEGMQRFCYDGDSEPTGECRPGQSKCEDGFWGPCLMQVLPIGELCNNDDDDCDGQTDEDLELATCDTAMEGECAVGTLVCGAGAAICQQTIVPQAEQCDAKDNDCDGDIDEGEIGQAACFTGTAGGCTQVDGLYQCLGTCRTGVQTCVEGETQPCLGEVVPVDEDCDKQPGPGNTLIAADEDCDGNTDEGCDCALSAVQDCYGGPPGTLGVGACESGEQSCMTAGAGTAWGPCLGADLPSAETCANPGQDNDCNDEVDDIPLVGTPCTGENRVGRCQNGTRQCVDDELACVTLEPRDEETCDSSDDDCDGDVDEGFNLQEDEQNCGSCGNACDDGETCCSGRCVDTESSETHCGACGARCGSGITCCKGSCVDTQTNMPNCGGCGQNCTGLGACCKTGMCSSLLCL